MVAAIQYYSDKTLADNKGASLHPMQLSLLNVGYSARMKLSNLTTVGYLPILARPAQMSKENFRKLKHTVRQRCLGILMEPFKQISHQGARMNDPSGTSQLVFPRLLTTVGDHPELTELLGIFNSALAKLPCIRCLVPRELMHRMDKVFKPCTLASHAAALQEIQAAQCSGRCSIGRADEARQKHSSMGLS